MQQSAGFIQHLLCSEHFGAESETVRRLEQFAVGTTKGKHSDLFQLEHNIAHYTRNDDGKYREHIYHKSRFPRVPCHS